MIASNWPVALRIRELRRAVPHRKAELDELAKADSVARTVRNVRVQTLIQLSGEVMSVLERRGVVVLRITKTNKSLIIGSSEAARS